MKPFFSVIIPTLNEEKFIPKLLSDLTKQKETNFETIVVDGMSDDNTINVIERFKDGLNIAIHQVKKRNVSYQRNFGAHLAKGVYLIFLDADARIGTSFVKVIKKTVAKNKYLILLPAIEPDDKSYQYEITFKIINFIVEASQVVGKPFSNSGSMILQKDYFNFIGGFDEKLYLAEDHEIVQRARRFGVSAKLLKAAILKFSLRRLEKEGRLDVFIKYLIASIHYLQKGRIYEKIFEYKMGGEGYEIIKRRSKRLDITIKEYFDKIKKQLDQVVS